MSVVLIVETVSPPAPSVLPRLQSLTLAKSYRSKPFSESETLVALNYLAQNHGLNDSMCIKRSSPFQGLAVEERNALPLPGYILLTPCSHHACSRETTSYSGKPGETEGVGESERNT